MQNELMKVARFLKNLKKEQQIKTYLLLIFI